MRIHRIKLHHYRGVLDSEVSFATDGVTIVEGSNEVGKTSLTEALDLILKYPDGSKDKAIKAIRPAGNDVGTEVEVEISTGPYHFVYFKRWHRQTQTTLRVSTPRPEQLAGRDAHARVNEILDETLDNQLWAALSLKQGGALARTGFAVPSLGAALDLAAGADIVDDDGDALWDRIQAERDRYWTATGQPKVERTSATSELAEAQRIVADLESKISQLDDEVLRVAQLDAAAAALTEARDKAKEQVGELVEREKDVNRLRTDLERLEAQSNAAASERDRWIAAREQRDKEVALVAEHSSTLADREAQAKISEPQRLANLKDLEATTTALEEARTAERTAKDALDRAIRTRDYLREKIECEQIGERYARVVEAQARLDAAEQVLETARVDGRLVTAIENATIECVKAEAEATAGAATVAVTALRDVNLEINGEGLPLPDGSTHEDTVTDSIELVVADTLRLSVRAGRDAQVRTREMQTARDALDALCIEGGVRNVEEARVALATREDANRRRTEAAAAIDRDLRDLTPEVLLNKLERLRQRIRDYEASEPAVPDGPRDLDEATELVHTRERAFDAAREHLSRLDASAARTSEALTQAEIDRAGLTAQIEQARSALRQSEASLNTARNDCSDEDLRARVAECEQQFRDTHAGLTAASVALAAEDPVSVMARLENARAVMARAQQEYDANRQDHRDLRGHLEREGLHGWAAQLDEAITTASHLQREYERLEERGTCSQAVIRHIRNASHSSDKPIRRAVS